MKILIVDDEILIRKVIKEYCILENYEVVEAENGIDAIEKIKHDNIDLIVLDVMMPKLDGLSAFKEIKKIKNIPTIVLSARSEEFDKLTGFGCSCSVAGSASTTFFFVLLLLPMVISS